MEWIDSLIQKQKEERQILKECSAEIKVANEQLVIRLLKIGIFGYSCLVIISRFIPAYNSIFLPHAITLSMLILYLFIYKRKKPKFSSIYLIYIGYAAVVAGSIYASAFCTPQNVTVAILAILFVIPNLILDGSLRVNCIASLYAVIYLVCIFPFKDKFIMIDEIVNVVTFVIMAIFIGNYLRKTRLENIEMRRQAVLRENIDPLTGLYNRRKLYEILWDEEKENLDKPIKGTIMMDIDCFKQYNDTYGHQMGDECLRKMGAYFSTISEAHPITFFRYGGEEFMAIARVYEDGEVISLCEKIRNGVVELKIPHETYEGKFITISVGLDLATTAKMNSYEDMLTNADIALYCAKDRGRNCVVVYKKEMESCLSSEKRRSCLSK